MICAVIGRAVAAVGVRSRGFAAAVMRSRLAALAARRLVAAVTFARFVGQVHHRGGSTAHLAAAERQPGHEERHEEPVREEPHGRFDYSTAPAGVERNRCIQPRSVRYRRAATGAPGPPWPGHPWRVVVAAVSASAVVAVVSTLLPPRA